MPRLTALVVTLLVASSLAQAQAAAPADSAKTIAPFVEAETLGVAHVDIRKIQLGAFLERAKKQLTEAGVGEIAQDADRAAQAYVKQLTDAGCGEIYFVFTLQDMPKLPVYAIVPVKEGADDKQIALALSSNPGSPAPKAPYGLWANSARIGQALVFGSPEQIERLKQNKPADRPELADAFAAAGDGAVQVVLLPTDTTRRVLEEAMPQLPEQVGGGPMTTVTKGVRWAALGLAVSDKPWLKLTIQSADADSAKALVELFNKAVKAIGEQQEIKDVLPVFDKLAALLTPAVEKDRLVLNIDGTSVDLAISAAMPALARARQRAKQAVSAANLMGILKGMLLYSFDNKEQFPPDLAALVKTGVINEKMLINPSRPEMKPAYIYVKPSVNRDKIDPWTVVGYENYDKWGDGINVGFAGGMVEFIRDEPRFKKLLSAASQPTGK